MQLADIIRKHAAHACAVNVFVNPTKRRVCIRDASGSKQEDIVLSDGAGDEFVQQMDVLAESAPDLLHDQAVRFLAKPYTDALWR
jgi:hypothetical protein